MGKTTDRFGKMKFQLPQNLSLSQNLCCKQRKKDRVIDASFRLYGEFQVEKFSLAFLWNFMKCLNEDIQKEKKNEHFLCLGSKAVLITTDANFLDTKYEYYGFNYDLRDTLN